MSRYINADRVHRDCEMRFADTGVPYEWAYALTIIDQAPTDDVSPVVHGRWLTWEEQFPGEMPRKKADWVCSAPLATTILTICLTTAQTADVEWTERMNRNDL